MIFFSAIIASEELKPAYSYMNASADHIIPFERLRGREILVWAVEKNKKLNNAYAFQSLKHITVSVITMQLLDGDGSTATLNGELTRPASVQFLSK
jgi:hypothetical protein